MTPWAGTCRLFPVVPHKVHIYIEYHSVCPRVGIGTPPFSRKRVCPSSWTKGRGGGTHTRRRLRGLGLMRRQEIKLSTLSTLCFNLNTVVHFLSVGWLWPPARPCARESSAGAWRTWGDRWERGSGYARISWPTSPSLQETRLSVICDRLWRFVNDHDLPHVPVRVFW
jgi:hypothetical protein